LTFAVAIAMADDNATKAMRMHAADFDKAMMAGDIGWFEKVSGPNFIEWDSQGHKADRTKAIQEIKASFALMKTSEISTTVTNVKEKGGAVTATFVTAMHGKLRHPKAPAKGIVSMEMTYDEHWVKEKGEWKIQWLRGVKDTMTVDGKPFGGGM
jgi:hypothetical protein